MDEMLSQEEINALLNGIDIDEDASEETTETVAEESKENKLTPEQKDAVGEVSNICMGTSATTLFSLVNQKVNITTPRVYVSDWDEFTSECGKPCVAIQITYTDGFDGSNLLLLKEDDVKVITDLMMGGDGTNTETEIGELQLSAIGEAMNQMIGSAATSMSTMFHKKVEIAPPISKYINLNESVDPEEITPLLSEEFIVVKFKLQIGDLVDSSMVQIYPLNFANLIYDEFMQTKENDLNDDSEKNSAEIDAALTKTKVNEDVMSQANSVQNMNQNMNQNMAANIMPGMIPNNQQMAGTYAQPINNTSPIINNNVNATPAQFANFDVQALNQQKENIDLIMDVGLEVSVELGRTRKTIKEVLEFSPGSIIELNKLSGEPVDVLVNGKIVAKGEVVVIDENFSVRVTEIMK